MSAEFKITEDEHARMVAFVAMGERAFINGRIRERVERAWEQGYIAGLNDAGLGEDQDGWHDNPYALPDRQPDGGAS